MYAAALRDNVARLFPGYFAMVMATGIVSIAAHGLGLEPVARALLVVNVAAYAVLGVMTAARVVAFPRRVLADLSDHGRGPGFFTLVAGTCVLGGQIQLLTGATRVAWVCYGAGAILWFVIMYAFFIAVTIRPQKPTIEAGINGAWLLAVVATQSVSVLGTLLAPSAAAHREALLGVSLCMYLLGCMLYLTVITLIFYRLTFLALEPSALTPPYWINMGAVAITTMAGAGLLLHTGDWAFLADLRSFLAGFTLLFWTTATWWIPFLLGLGIWRHVRRRYPLAYDPLYWAMVFPLGMYTACTLQLARATGLACLATIPRLFIWIALAAWVTVFLGTLRGVTAQLLHPTRGLGVGQG